VSRTRRDLEQLIHHGDRGVQYLSIRYTERLVEAGIERSVGSVGDSDDNALAESVIGLFKAEVINQRGPWRGAEPVESATLEWADWLNNRRLLEPIGNIPPAEREQAYHVAQHAACAARAPQELEGDREIAIAAVNPGGREGCRPPFLLARIPQPTR
jgi:transposase InsO family protein